MKTEKFLVREGSKVNLKDNPTDFTDGFNDKKEAVMDFVKNDKDIWKKRYRQIRNWEEYLAENGTHVVKFFLNVSREEQRRRFLERIDLPDKNWKFSASDAKEAALWDDYMKAYEDAIEATSTKNSPWYVIPADKKWFMRLAVSEIIVKRMESLDLHYPVVTEAHKAELAEAKKLLENKA